MVLVYREWTPEEIRRRNAKLVYIERPHDTPKVEQSVSRDHVLVDPTYCSRTQVSGGLNRNFSH